ncbi:hypothetical protein OV208_21560 [Corallococcus sp. bb12-1]|uniref:hypothetical protein n=1 Tax=Corallococcus sp. bb12-1 TaxID=2996784 RepID=UPI00226E7F96|nr:hypothetical protein [Corallococcus sp. bb12-1]MCY1043919.1 hypothetical protein [Corallococcus sp. bb12-1]
MRDILWKVLAGAAVFATAAVGWSLKEGDSATPPVSQAPTGAPADVSRELQALRIELETLRQGQGRLSAQVRQTGGSAVAAVPGTGVTPVAPASPPTSEQVEVEAELESAANTEARDPEWTRGTESAVARAFQSPTLAGAHLTRVDCRARVCVLEVEHDTPASRAELLPTLMELPELRGQMVLRPTQVQGRAVSRIYLSRPGERLPMTSRR